MTIWDFDDDEKETIALCVAKDGSLYFEDNGNLLHVDSQGEVLGVVGPECGRLTSIARDNQNRLFAIDFVEGNIKIFDTMKCKMIDTIEAPFGTPSSICWIDGQIYVTDQELHVVHIIAESGDYVASCGCEGDGRFQFQGPTDIDANPNTGELYVCDSGNNRIQVLSDEGDFLRSWGALGSESGDFQNPIGVVYDAQSNVVAVVDQGNNRVQGFSADRLGQVLWIIPDLETPIRAGIDHTGDILVVDQTGMDWFASPLVENQSDTEDDDQDSFIAEFNDEEDSEAYSDDNFDNTADHGKSLTRDFVKHEISSSGSDDDEDDLDTHKRNSVRDNRIVPPISLSDGASEAKVDRPVRSIETKETPRNVKQRDSSDEPPASARVASARSRVPPLETKTNSGAARNIRRKFVADELTMKDKVLELRSRAEALKVEMDTLEDTKLALMKQNVDAETRDPVEDVRSKSRNAIKGLETVDDVLRCNDIMVIEEKILEIRILDKDMKRIIPQLRENTRKAQANTALERNKLSQLTNDYENIPKRFTSSGKETKGRLESYREELEMLQQEKTNVKKNQQKRRVELQKKREALNSQLIELRDALKNSRLELSKLEYQASSSRGKNSARSRE